MADCYTLFLFLKDSFWFYQLSHLTYYQPICLCRLVADYELLGVYLSFSNSALINLEQKNISMLLLQLLFHLIFNLAYTDQSEARPSNVFIRFSIYITFLMPICNKTGSFGNYSLPTGLYNRSLYRFSLFYLPENKFYGVLLF